jgi:hypothetical protein
VFPLSGRDRLQHYRGRHGLARINDKPSQRPEPGEKRGLHAIRIWNENILLFRILKVNTEP